MSIEETLSLILKKLDTQEELLQLAISNLTTRKEVANFLSKSEKTIDNYVKNGTFEEDIHFFHNEKNKIEFIPTAILEFKKHPQIHYKTSIKPKEQKVEKIYHSSLSCITKGLKVG